jgi:hypothetical protein
MSTVRRTLVAVAALLALTVAAGACSREDAVDDASSSSTVVDGTTIPASDTTVPSSDTTAPPTDSTDTTASSSTTEETDIFGNTPSQNAAYRAAYRAAFEGECRRIWATYAGADGIMSDPDFPEDPYVVDDCLADIDDSWGEFASSVEEAQASGTDDAQIAASDLADPLCDSSGTRCFSYGD